MKCVIVDDEPHSASLMEKYIALTEGMELTKAFHVSEEAKEYILANPGDVDIAFLDIDMPGMNGIELAEFIGNSCLVIFTTGHKDFGADSYRQNAVDYLLKPIRYEHFLEAFQKAKARSDHARKYHKFFYAKERMEGKLVKINIEEIIFIQSHGNYVHIMLISNKKYLVHLSLRKVLSSLPSNLFSQIHKSHVVNLEHVQSIAGNKMCLVEDHELQIGETFKTKFVSHLERFMIR